MLRARERILVSPERPLVTTPTFNNTLRFEKQCGLNNTKVCRAQINIPKSFYRANEVAYFDMTIDNSQVGAICSLNVTHEVTVAHINSRITW